MTTTCIKYWAGYKYQLAEDFQIQTTIRPPEEIEHRYFSMTKDGLLTVKESYAWDGASGPTMDTKSSMRGALVHDVLWQMLRLNLLPESYRPATNAELRRICVLDGMFRWRAATWEWAVTKFGKKWAGKGEEPVLTAP